MAKMISLTIDGVQVQAREGTTVLEAARAVNIKIPTLCFLKGLNAIGACRVCVVDVGGRALQAACVLPVAEGMVVKTNTPAVRTARKVNLELILSTHDKKCLTCPRSQNCELQQLCQELGIEDSGRFEGSRVEYTVDDFSPSVVRDNNKCILCRRCVAACSQQQQVGVIGAVNRGFTTSIESPWQLKLSETACINCGQCIAVCPVGALQEKDETGLVWNLLSDEKSHVVVQPAPSIRVALGEEFGLPIGTDVTGKLVTALKRLGFDKVFDTDCGADFTIVEEATELVNRVTQGGVLPMITSCSPGWVKFCEHNYPEFIPNLSSCKSPQQMLGALIKSYYAQRANISPKDIKVVSVMPCTAKKFEADRPEMSGTGYPDVDAVVTTRELARMIKEAGIDFANLEDGEFDNLLGESSGAAVIFGATGGVMEAALRTAYAYITGEELGKVEFETLRGVQGIKEAEVAVGDLMVRIAVANGTANAARLLEMIKSGEKEYHFIEIMACPGGCVTGGGQPIISAQQRMVADPRVLRAQSLYAHDQQKPLRRSHENQEVLEAYKTFLGKPNGHLAHQLLHTHYTARPKYPVVKKENE